MLTILAVTFPIYLIIALGFLLTRGALFARADMRVFGKFVINLALPALVFKALSQRQFADIVNSGYLLAYLLGSLAVLTLGYFGARRLRHMPQSDSALFAMGMACSNSGFVGYPILLLTLAPVAGVALALNMLVENLIVIPLLLVLAERGRGSGNGWQALVQSLKRLITTPLFLALMAGLLVSLLGLSLPAPLAQTISMFSAASGALSLFVIGGSLVGLPLAGMGQKVWPIVLGKLLLHPLLVWLCLLALPLLGVASVPAELLRAAVLLAAMPMMGIYATLAQAYGQEDSAAAATLLGTVVSFFTVSGMLWLLLP